MQPTARERVLAERERDAHRFHPCRSRRHTLDDALCGAPRRFFLVGGEREMHPDPAAHAAGGVRCERIGGPLRVDAEPLVGRQEPARLADHERRGEPCVYRFDRISARRAQRRTDAIESRRIGALLRCAAHRCEMRARLVELTPPERLARRGARYVGSLEQRELRLRHRTVLHAVVADAAFWPIEGAPVDAGRNRSAQ